METVLERQPVTSSKIEITADERRAMGDVIDRWRLNQGWMPYDNETQDMAISSYVTSLRSEKIPAEAYNELYERVIKLRAIAVLNDKDLPKFGVELMIACWNGPHGLCKEIEQRRINQKRTLPDVAASQCPRCFGTGMENVFDDKTGRILGVRPGRCQHKPLQPGEWLYKQAHQDAEAEIPF